MKKRYLFLFLLLTPLWMWIGWLLLPNRTLVAAIVDKTVLDQSGQEHSSLIWLMNHQRFTKTPTESYESSRDYYGFFPEKDKKFSIKGLERLSMVELNSLSQNADLAYYTDTYGISRSEWLGDGQQTERSGILYGGMSRSDVRFLKAMKARHKLILAEFNVINSPTEPGVRQEFEKTFGVHWSGWIGRYFDSLDTTVNEELPRWLVRNYRRQHNGQWPFTRSGIAFVSERDEVVILEKETHLEREVPYMVSSAYGQTYFDLPKRLPYSYWFDVMINDPAINREVATHEVYANAAGRQELARAGIPSRFPAIMMHKGPDYEFYYFAGDFCDNPVSLVSSYFRAIEFAGPLFYWAEGLAEREGFFWRVYQPMTTRILEDYYQRTRKN